eukprot:1930463-Ditylum_brightwellii.AAC.1
MLRSSGTFLSSQHDPPKKGALPPQTGFKGYNGIFDEMIYLLSKDNTIMNNAANGEPSYAWGKSLVFQIQRKGQTTMN